MYKFILLTYLSLTYQSVRSMHSNSHWKCLCLVSWAAAPCVWTL